MRNDTSLQEGFTCGVAEWRMLPTSMPLLPMEARSVPELPVGEEWQYEPKWDGFRCLAYRDGDGVTLWSKSGQDLTRYFPEVGDLLKGVSAKRFVLDGELIVPQGKSSSFEQLLMRIHPAASRVARLANEHPAMFVVFDLLVDAEGRDLTGLVLRERRGLLEAFAGEVLTHTRVPLSPVTRDAREAARWLKGATGIDGVIAKRLDMAYQAGERTGMQKVKRLEAVDCVVGGFRFAERSTPQKPEVGSLLLGLYNAEGKLDHVGFCSSFDAAEKRRLAPLLMELIAGPGAAGFTGKAPGGPSRWSSKRSMEWQPLRPMLVCEVRYDHFSEGRFRHGTKFMRWRPDKEARICTFEQVTRPTRGSLSLLRSA
jgi:ATP-dependent DNA ligase